MRTLTTLSTTLATIFPKDEIVILVTAFQKWAQYLSRLASFWMCHAITYCRKSKYTSLMWYLTCNVHIKVRLAVFDFRYFEGQTNRSDKIFFIFTCWKEHAKSDILLVSSNIVVLIFLQVWELYICTLLEILWSLHKGALDGLDIVACMREGNNVCFIVWKNTIF
jgi:hypothetical protein